MNETAMPTDADLLRDYAADRSESAFAELVRRHLDGVYSAALRRVGGDTHLAKDVAQAVFIALARQSRALASHPFLTAWLYAATRNEAASTVRRERRRKTREAVASAMNETNSSSSAESAADWSRLSPVLDDAIDQLSETDRTAILLRYINRRPFAEIGAQLRVTEDAARMRVDRALDKLRTLLAKRGLTSTSAALGVVLTTNAVAAAPSALVNIIVGAALTTLPATATTGATAVAFMITTKTTLTIAAIACALIASIAVHHVVRTPPDQTSLAKDQKIHSSVPSNHHVPNAQLPSIDKTTVSPQSAQPSQPQTFASKIPAGTYSFTPGKPLSSEELARLRREKIVEAVAAYDRACEPFYSQLGLNDAETQQKFLMLKTKQVEEQTDATQSLLRAYIGKSREDQEREISVSTERIYASFIKRVSETFGETTANAVHLFESAQKAAYKELAPNPLSEKESAPRAR
jgi:RNA polymerase sigma factor (sigma-70 family)